MATRQTDYGEYYGIRILWYIVGPLIVMLAAWAAARILSPPWSSPSHISTGIIYVMFMVFYVTALIHVRPKLKYDWSGP